MNRYVPHIWVFFRRLVVALVGSVVILLGIVLLPTPGPGIVVILGGVAILSLEFQWARDLLQKMRKKFAAFLQKKRDARRSAAQEQSSDTVESDKSSKYSTSKTP